MKVPFRSQVSEFDCVPATFVNALVYLFEREQIPPTVLQRIYQYSLDTVTSRQRIGRGTSGFAVKLLANYLSEVAERAFRLDVEVFEDSEVSLGTNNRIARCLNDEGIVLLRVKDTEDDWHYILGLQLDDQWLYSYDPYHTRGAEEVGQFEFLEETRLHDPNLRVSRSRLDTQTNRSRYCLGTVTERQCVLLRRR